MCLILYQILGQGDLGWRDLGSVQFLRPLLSAFFE